MEARIGERVARSEGRYVSVRSGYCRPLIPVTVTAFEPEVVASPESSAEVTVCVEPANRAIPAPGEEATTQVVQVSVPVVVIVPPPSGEVVAMLVTVPLPLIVLQLKAPVAAVKTQGFASAIAVHECGKLRDLDRLPVACRIVVDEIGPFGE